MIEQLVQAAGLHAAEQHGLASPLSVKQVDHIVERHRGDPGGDAIVACYGAWFGQYLLDQWGGNWLGLEEPVPPRISIEGTLYSPFDAVARRLEIADAPPLSTLAHELSELRQAALGTPTPSDVQQHNLTCWNELAQSGHFVNQDWVPQTRDEALAAIDPWLRAEGLDGKYMLCLAAGGGTHGPLHARAGAMVTVVDFCDKLLAIDRALADTWQLAVETRCCSMEDLAGLESATFDVVVQPVSLCYVPHPRNVYREVCRVLRPGGVYVVQHKSPTSLQIIESERSGYRLAINQRVGHALPAVKQAWEHRETNAMEYAHSLEQLLGDLCRSGFVIEAFREPVRGDAWAAVGSAPHRALYAPPYIKLKARRIAD